MGWFESFLPVRRHDSEENVKSSPVSSPAGTSTDQQPDHKTNSTVIDFCQGELPKVQGPGEGAGAPAPSTETRVSSKIPQTLEEAWAVLRGEGDTKPNFERVASSVSVALAGGYILGWREAVATAAKYPAHQHTLVKRARALKRGAKFGAFALVYEGSVVCLGALRQKTDYFNGAAGGALAGTAFGVSGGLSAAGRGLFIGSWLGAVVEAFHIHLRETTKEALRLESLHKLEEEMREAEEERAREVALKNAIGTLERRLAAWPDTAAEDPAGSPEPAPVEQDNQKRKRGWLW